MYVRACVCVYVCMCGYECLYEGGMLRACKLGKLCWFKQRWCYVGRPNSHPWPSLLTPSPQTNHLSSFPVPVLFLFLYSISPFAPSHPSNAATSPPGSPSSTSSLTSSFPLSPSSSASTLPLASPSHSLTLPTLPQTPSTSPQPRPRMEWVGAVLVVAEEAMAVARPP